MSEPPTGAAFLALGDEDFVSLTTFRRDGTPVPTPVWVARDGDALLVTTAPTTGKVKRLRNNPQVELRPCSRSGKVADDAPTVTGRAEILAGPAAVDRVRDLLRAKYGVQYRVMMLVERAVARRQRVRVGLRITAR